MTIMMEIVFFLIPMGISKRGDNLLILTFQVSRIYKDPSIGNPISISVVKVMKAIDTFGVKHQNSAGIAANEMLKKFCLWQKHNNAPEQGHPNHHDVALLLTRFNIPFF